MYFIKVLGDECIFMWSSEVKIKGKSFMGGVGGGGGVLQILNAIALVWKELEFLIHPSTGCQYLNLGKKNLSESCFSLMSVRFSSVKCAVVYNRCSSLYIQICHLQGEALYVVEGDFGKLIFSHVSRFIPKVLSYLKHAWNSNFYIFKSLQLNSNQASLFFWKFFKVNP